MVWKPEVTNHVAAERSWESRRNTLRWANRETMRQDFHRGACGQIEDYDTQETVRSQRKNINVSARTATTRFCHQRSTTDQNSDDVTSWIATDLINDAHL